MPTWLTSVRNQLRSPSGAPNEAPDGPGAFQALRDDVDNFIGVGGAEFSTILSGIPSGRKFLGKLAYHSPSDTVYRYVGAGNTALGANNASAQWQAWSKPATSFVPSWSNLTIGSSSTFGQWGIVEGLAWINLAVSAGTNYAISATLDVAMGTPTPIVCGLGVGTGLYVRAGGSGNNVQVDLALYPIGTNGQASSSVRVRAKYANAAPGPVTQNLLGSVIAATTTDSFQVSLTAPSALVA